MENTVRNSGVQRSRKGLISAALFLLTYLVARFVLKQTDLSESIRISAALLPVLPFAWLLREIIKGVRSLDELEQRIQLEALAVAYPLAMVLLMTLGLLEIAVVLPPADLGYRHVWAMLPLFYFIGMVVARRRYQ